MLVAGQITRPPRRSWSKVVLIDMHNLPCLRRRRHPLARIRSILRILL
jgi:hypothetical protein